MYGWPSDSPTSKIVTVFGVPESRAAASASRLKRSLTDSSSAYRSASTLIATARPSCVSVARYTSPIPPRARCCGSRYRGGRIGRSVTPRSFPLEPSQKRVC